MDDLLTTRTIYTAQEDAGAVLPDPPRRPDNDILLHQAPEPDAPQKRTPFIIELRRVDDVEGGHFRPEAVLIVTAFLRTSGLLKALAAEDLASLLTQLTFLTPNGDILPTTPELARALGIADRAVRYRMERLMGRLWQGKPLVLELKRASGLNAYTVSPELIAVRQETPRKHLDSHQVLPPSSREAVIARSRATYAKPRREVEAMIARLNNWDLPGPAREGPGDDTSLDETRTLQTRLMLAGVPREQADVLLARYPLARIRAQLDWLPLRGAKSPARFLVAAIEKDFDPPRGLSLPGSADTIHLEPSPAGAEAPSDSIPPG